MSKLIQGALHHHSGRLFLFFRLSFLLLTLFASAPLFGDEPAEFQSPESILPGEEDESILPIHEYENEPTVNAEEEIAYRAEIDPLNIISTAIFVLAIIHIFFARRISQLAARLNHRYAQSHGGNVEHKYFLAEILHFLGEVEIIFGIWVIPLLIAITWSYDWETALDYLNSRNYVEAIAVMIVMVMASTRPILNLGEKIMGFFAGLAGNTPASWWFVLLTIGPILGAFITEAGGMTLTALLLIRAVYRYRVSERLAYATMGLLFTNVSLGGIITVFASPPALMASEYWEWNSWYMLTTFGWRSVLSMLVSNLCYWFYFRKEFQELALKAQEHKEERDLNHEIPFWVTLGNLLFMAFIVTHLHEPVLFIGMFFFFLGYYQATSTYQKDLTLRPALMVAFFIGGLVIHAGLQEWWIAPLLDHADAKTMLTLSVLLGPFTDNAALTYLATLIPNLPEDSKYAVVVGAVAAGGITVMANAPNPAGQQILGKHFPDGISPRKLALGALIPAAIAIAIFILTF